MSLYKLIIAEDEALARQGMERCIDFQDLGFDAVASCEDGKEAWEAFLKWQPDLLITDINMPNMSGLELAGRIAESSHPCKVVILTGYDSFDFARQAIDYKVSDYLLKPISPRDLRKLLSRYRDEFDLRGKERRNLLDQISRNIRTENLAKNQLLNMFISGQLTDDAAEQLHIMAPMLLNQAYYVLATIISHPQNLPPQAHKLKKSDIMFLVYNLADELSVKYESAVAFQSTDGNVNLLVAANNAAQAETGTAAILGEIQRVFRKLTSIPLIAACSTPYPEKELRRASDEARMALEYALNERQQAIVSYGRMLKTARDGLLVAEEQLIEKCIHKSIKELPKATGDYVMALRFSKLERQELLERIRLLFIQLKNEGVIIAQAGNINVNDLDMLQDNPLPLRDYLLSELSKALELIQERGSNVGAKELARMAQRYIEDNFSDRNLSLAIICQHLNVSLSYFSSIFKNETGRTFVEFLTEVRMQKARELLAHTDIKLYNIAEMVGYESAAYFTTSFKKHMGYTPKEYRKLFYAVDTL